jgi:hypothetical protein
MGKLLAADARPSGEWGGILALLPDIVLAVADVSVVHPGAASYMRAAAQTDGTAAVSKDAEKWAKYGVGKQVAASGFVPLSTERDGMGLPATNVSTLLGYSGSFFGCSWFRDGHVNLLGWCFARLANSFSTRESGCSSGGSECLYYCRRHTCHQWRGCGNS